MAMAAGAQGLIFGFADGVMLDGHSAPMIERID